MKDVQIEILPNCFTKPTRATDGSAGYDVYAANKVPLNIFPNTVTYVPLGFKTSFDKNMVALLFPRSGLATKQGLVLANTIGVIDSDYPEEWMAALTVQIWGGVTLDSPVRDEPITNVAGMENCVLVNPGDRIGQVVFLPCLQVRFVEQSITQSTDRRSGFGSTGV